MSFLVPLLLGGLAIAVMVIISVFANQKKKKQRGQAAPLQQSRILIHAINDDRCTGCDACVAVCPTNVLDLISNKSRVLRFQDCIQCEACMWACPTEALVMFPEGTQPPPIRVPNLDPNFQTMVPGQYLIGEVAGKPLIKNAANLGRAVIEHMLQTGLRPGPSQPGQVDVLIVGSGPGGMSAALSCAQRGLSYLILEKENIISSTVSRYPKGKHVMAEPYDAINYSLLPVMDCSKEEMVNIWKELAGLVELKINMHETVQMVQKQPNGSFLTTTTAAQYSSQRIVLATGTRGKPRTLGVVGEHLPKVESLLEDPSTHSGQAVCIVGGGDSALEAAIALSESRAKVIVSYRGRSFHRAQAKNRQKIDALAKAGQIKIKMQSEVVEFAQETVTLQMSDGTQKRYPNHAAFVLIGADPPIQWLSSLGINYVEKPHMQAMPASDAMVSKLVPGARDCPENASDAAAQIFGRPMRTKVPSHVETPGTDRSASMGRRFIRSASSLLHLGDSKAKKPIPLSEFVKGTGPRRRDELEPGERTRLLRMLRDEGGRMADEDSKLHHIGLLQDDTSTEFTAAFPSAALPHVPALAVSEDQFLSTLPIAPMPTAPKPAVVTFEKMSGPAPTEARIVGLASAAAKAPHSAQKPSEQQYEPQGSAQETDISILAAEEATLFSEYNPSEIIKEVEEENTFSFLDEGSSHDDATRTVDIESLIAKGELVGLIEKSQEATKLTEVDPQKDFNFNDKTRVVDEKYEPHALSKVEWDLEE